MLCGAGTLATRALAGSVRHVDGGVIVDPDRPGADIVIIIKGSDVSGLLYDTSLSVTEEIGTRSACKFELRDREGTYHPQVGAPVHVYYKGAIVFAGTIDAVDEMTPENSNELFLVVDCVDFNQFADRHVVTAVYDSKTIREIVTDIINSTSGELGERLSDEGVVVTATSVTNDPTLVEHIAFNYDTPANAFDKLGDMTGLSWWIDYQKVFHFHDATYYRAPVNFDDVSFEVYAKLRHKLDRKDYRNIQILKGGRDTTPAMGSGSERRLTFQGDNETKVFTLDLELADKPRIWVGATEVDPADIGLQGAKKPDDSDYIWYYSLDDKEVSQNSDDLYPALTETQTLLVWYQGFFPIVQISRYDDEVETRKAVEGGTGIYIDVEEDEDIDDLSLAIERSDGLLRRHGVIAARFTFQTTHHGFHAGQYLTAAVARHNISGEYLVESLKFSSFSDDPDQPFRYEVTCVLGEFRGSWSDWFKRLAQKGKPWKANENTVVQASKRLTSRLKVSATERHEIGNTLVPWEQDWITFAICGQSYMSRVPPLSYNIRASAIGRIDSYGNPTGPLIGGTPREM